ncbi:MAG: hypothetical protein AAF266_11950 [Planctomycetota bacterium]
MKLFARYRAGVAAATIALAVMLVGASLAEANPQWRLRRWSSRPPIDPTIRSTVSFGTPSARSYHRGRYSSPIYRSYRVRYR